jgi:hypothetical protein
VQEAALIEHEVGTGLSRKEESDAERNSVHL